MARMSNDMAIQMLLGTFKPSEQQSFLRTINQPKPAQSTNNQDRDKPQQVQTKAPSQTDFKNLFDLNRWVSKNNYSLTPKDGYVNVADVRYQSNNPRSGSNWNTVPLYGPGQPSNAAPAAPAASSATTSASSALKPYTPTPLGTDSGGPGSASDPFKDLANEPTKPVFQSSIKENLTANATGFRAAKSSWRKAGRNTKGTSNLKIKSNFSSNGTGVGLSIPV